ncbi:MAG: response regulator transcription factor [Chloroflexi bacterium]|nr:response regulator transcription factor [Chloroflexota bacterium]
MSEDQTTHPFILIIEDDAGVARFVKRALQTEGYIVDVAPDGETGLAKTFQNFPDLIILDWMLPGIDGLEVCRRIRTRDQKIPILMLTAKDSVPDRVLGLDSGADDYLVKPFSMDELLARVRVLLRRRRAQVPPKPKEYRFADLVLDTGTRQARRGDRVIELTTKEYQLLETFMRHPRQVLTRDQLYDQVWGYDFGRESNVLDVYVRYLRRKLEANGEPRLLHTVRGVGYVLREPSE